MALVGGIFKALSVCFFILAIVSAFNPKRGSFWLKYLNIELTRAKSILSNLRPLHGKLSLNVL